MGKIKELKTDEEWRRAWPALAALRPRLPLRRFLAARKSLQKRGYRLFGLCDKGRIVCVAGAAIQPHVEHGLEFWIHDLATLAECRSRGYGAKLLKWLDSYAKRQGCFRLSLHTRIQRRKAHRFYKREGLEKTAYVFQRDYRQSGRHHPNNI